MNNQLYKSPVILKHSLPALFQDGGEGSILCELLAAFDTESASESELRAMKSAIDAALVRWFLRQSFTNNN